MKRKILCLLLALTLINIGGLSALASTPVDVYDEYLYLYETFEEDTIAADKAAGELTISESKNTAQYETPGANGTKGAVHMQYKADNSYNAFKVKLVPGQKYRASAWIKLNDISLKENELHLIYWSKMVDKGDTYGYAVFMINDAGLKKNEWVQVSTEFTCPEQVRIAGVGNYDVDPDAVGKIGIRFGDNGQFSNIDGYADDNSLFYDFSIDDFVVEPVVEDVTVDDSVTLTFTGSDYSYSNSTDVPAGITGQSRCVTSKASTSAPYVNLKYKAPEMWMNKAYKISYWAKAQLADGGSYGNVSVVVYNQTANAKDSRIPKWPTYNLTAADGTSTLTNEWKYYEYIYYVGLNAFEERLDSTVEFRVGCGTVAGSKVYMAGMNIEPLNMPYNDVIVRNTAVPTTSAASKGWYLKGLYSYSEITGDSAVETKGYAIPLNSERSFSQYVQIKDNTKYKISFKAKANVSIPVFITLDRDPGNASSVKQYITGVALGKDSAWDAATANQNMNWNLTDEWQEFSVIYEWDYTGEDEYKMPLMSFHVGNTVTSLGTATLSIADMKIEEVTGAVAEVKNIELDGTLAKDSKIDIDYDVTGATEGISYVRILAGSDAAGWGTLDVVKASELKAGYTIPAEWVGKNIKLEVLPIQPDGTVGEASSISVGTIAEAAYEFTPVFDAWTGDAVSANVAINAIPSAKSTDVKIILATYKADESLSDVQIIPVPVTGGMNTSQPISITDGEAVTAKIFVLENSTLKPVIGAVPATKAAAN